MRGSGCIGRGNPHVVTFLQPRVPGRRNLCMGTVSLGQISGRDNFASLQIPQLTRVLDVPVSGALHFQGLALSVRVHGDLTHTIANAGACGSGAERKWYGLVRASVAAAQEV